MAESLLPPIPRPLTPHVQNIKQRHIIILIMVHQSGKQEFCRTQTSLPYFRVKLSCVCLMFAYIKKVMTYSDPMVTYSHPKMTYSYPKVT